jgi:hypothetical protein
MLGVDSISILVDDRERPRVSTFPLSQMIPHAQTNRSVTQRISLDLPWRQQAGTQPVEPELARLMVLANTDDFRTLRNDSILAHRFWRTAPQQHYLARPLSDWRVYIDGADRHRGMLSHCTFPVPASLSTRHVAPLLRTFLAPIWIAQAPPPPRDGAGGGTRLIAAGCKHAVWIEVVRARAHALMAGDASGQALALRLCTIPSDMLRAEHKTPRWFVTELVRTIAVPPDVNLADVCIIALDEAHGMIALGMVTGKLRLLEL